jgi:hypothetical protein
MFTPVKNSEHTFLLSSFFLLAIFVKFVYCETVEFGNIKPACDNGLKVLHWL